ncbi:hypothetical protein Emag_004206 [Eimeria magna]
MSLSLAAYLSKHLCKDDPPENQTFGPWPIPANQIFLLSPLSYATVNLKPVLPGHVLVIPRRKVERMRDLTPEEIADLYQAVQAVGELLERRHSRKALTISTQDGVDAGQTVPHVHVHVLPRSPTDFERNDQVYEEIDAADMARERPAPSKGPDNEERRPRTDKDMAQEAADLRSFGLKLAAELAA